MKTILLVSAILVATGAAKAAETLSIEPAHALPDYTKLNLGTNRNSVFTNFIQTLGLGDFNGDGRLDIAVTLSPGHAGVSIQLQGADGSLTRSAEYAFPSLPVQPAPVWDYVTGDFNEDGYLDLIAAATGNDLIMFSGHGDGTFDDPYFMGLAAPNFPVVADFNGDGRLDLVSGKLSGTVGLFLGAGDGTFSESASLNSAVRAYHERSGQIMVADINHDGNLDVTVAAATTASNVGFGSLDVYFGNGDGTFQPVIQTPNAAVWKGVLGDFNGDGNLDFAGDRHSPQQLEILLGSGDGYFTRGAVYPLSFFFSDAIHAADLNDDGILDLVVSSESALGIPYAPTSIFRGNGNGTFQPREEFTPLNDAYIWNSGPRLVDFNGDGRTDIVSVGRFWTTTPTNRFGPNVLAVALNSGVKRDPASGFLLKVTGTNAPSATNAVVLEATTDLIEWMPIATNAPVAEWRMVDTNSTPYRFYRTRRD